MSKLKWTHLRSGIFRLLCIRAGQSLNLRDMARMLSVSPTAVSKSIKELEKYGLVKIEKPGKIKQLSIKFNMENTSAIDFKRIENLKMIYESGIGQYLSENLPGCIIILFGSYSFGEDVWFNTEHGHKSDIDIAIIGTAEKELELEKFEKFLQKEVSIHFYKNFTDIHKNLRNNIISGILLEGRIDL